MTNSTAEQATKHREQSYEQQYKDAAKKKETEEVSVKYYTFDGEGARLIGRLLYSEEQVNEDSGKPYFRHVFETDEGIVATIPGIMVDNVLKARDYIGRVLAIEFKGKEQLSGGRSVNVYKVEVVPG